MIFHLCFDLFLENSNEIRIKQFFFPFFFVCIKIPSGVVDEFILTHENKGENFETDFSNAMNSFIILVQGDQ